jgi:hypothetical protein
MATIPIPASGGPCSCAPPCPPTWRCTVSATLWSSPAAQISCTNTIKPRLTLGLAFGTFCLLSRDSPASCRSQFTVLLAAPFCHILPHGFPLCINVDSNFSSRTAWLDHTTDQYMMKTIHNPCLVGTPTNVTQRAAGHTPWHVSPPGLPPRAVASWLRRNKRDVITGDAIPCARHEASQTTCFADWLLKRPPFVCHYDTHLCRS